VEKRTDVLKELQDLNSSLVSKPAVNAFKVPEGFFSQQKSSISTALLSNEELDIKSESFTVPKDYFSQQREAIKAELQKEENDFKKKSRRVRKIWRQVASVAAILCLFIIGAYMWPVVDADENLLAALDDSTIIEYIESDFGFDTEMEEELIASVLDLDDPLWSEDGLDEASISNFLLEEDYLINNEYLDYEY